MIPSMRASASQRHMNICIDLSFMMEYWRSNIIIPLGVLMLLDTIMLDIGFLTNCCHWLEMFQSQRYHQTCLMEKKKRSLPLLGTSQCSTSCTSCRASHSPRVFISLLIISKLRKDTFSILNIIVSPLRASMLFLNSPLLTHSSPIGADFEGNYCTGLLRKLVKFPHKTVSILLSSQCKAFLTYGL